MSDVTIDGQAVPNLLVTAQEMARSLGIGVRYLRRLEGDGLPYYTLIGTPRSHRYDPIEVWKWWRAHVPHTGG